MTELLLHPKTKVQIATYAKKPPHAVLVVAPAGSGKGSVAELLAAEVLGLTLAQATKYPYIRRLSSEEDKQIGIESVRDLEQFLALKVPTNKNTNRVIIVEGGDKLTLEAQNAFLKTLEEPPEGTLLILTTPHARSLLPTIRSRAQIMQLQLPDAPATKQFFIDQGYTSSEVERVHAIAAGLPGVMTALLAQSDHPLLTAAEQAKKLLKGTMYDRLLAADELTKQRQLLAPTLDMLQQMAHISLQTAQGRAARRWQNVLEVSYEASEALKQNAQPKLVVTRLCLNL